MARIESVAVGGYYKTPEHLVPLIGQLIEPGHRPVVCDPCAGEGEAVELLLNSMGHPNGAVYTAELESGRAAICRQRFNQMSRSGKQVNWDAFQIYFSPGFAEILYLNPPYDTDRVHGRLEHKFLSRFTSVLAENGILIFIVPYYAMKASRELLAKEFENLACFRFPEGDFGVYKQVVLMGTRKPLLTPDPESLGVIDRWVESPESIPVLGEVKTQYSYPNAPYCGHENWEPKETDFVSLLRKFKPWRYTAAKSLEAVPHVLPEVPVSDLLFREYPIVTLPRPAHIAAGIASGMFNGRRVEPNTPNFPPILVKGVFDREYETVREIENKKGEVTSVVQAQKPKLITTIFDLNKLEYRTLQNEGGLSDGGLETLEDLLTNYSTGLMDVMLKQCPVMYHPNRDCDDVVLAPTNRKLYKAQEHATKALVKLIPQSRVGILLGEIGSGKTSVALTAAKTLAGNTLVMCPPHLLDSWRDEVRSILPEAEIRVLNTVSDVDALTEIPKDKFFVAILSRETAKLGHSLSSVRDRCPKCGNALEPGENYAKKRSRCEHTWLIPKDMWGVIAKDLAHKLFPYFPDDFQIKYLLSLPIHNKRRELPANANWQSWKVADFEALIPKLIKEGASDLLVRLFLACDYDLEAIRNAYSKASSSLKAELSFLLPPGDSVLTSDPPSWYEWGYQDTIKRFHEGHETKRTHANCTIQRKLDGTLVLDNHAQGSKEAAKLLFKMLCVKATFDDSQECGEFLYQSEPEPRRFPLAKYISKYHRKLFKFYIADECHEYATEGSAQEKAAHRICNLNVPTILMTGSLMNGYAESLFTNMWAASSEFRKEFERSEISRFVDRYGYRERVVTDKDKDNEVIVFGSQTDRVTRTARVTGDAPGILPLFLFRHLLKSSVTLHKGDLAIDLPPCTQHKHLIQPGILLEKAYKDLLDNLLKQIAKDRFKEEVAGKLFGALSELPSYLDRATDDVGNQPNGAYEVRYPASLGSALVASGASFPSTELLPKERWMVDTVISELKEGRNVLVFAWHVNLIPRLARILTEEIGEEVPVLKAEKVPTKTRQDWINKNVVHKRRRVMLANPMTVQTGLNNLVHFNTEIWMENPGANPNIVRQAVGRVDRIGAKKETRIHFPIYDNTLQVHLYDLLMKKIAVATSTDGLDPESVLLASGGSSSYMTGLSIGRQLWEMLKTSV